MILGKSDFIGFNFLPREFEGHSGEICLTRGTGFGIQIFLRVVINILLVAKKKIQLSYES